jgi:hypothetical protein
VGVVDTPVAPLEGEMRVGAGNKVAACAVLTTAPSVMLSIKHTRKILRNPTITLHLFIVATHHLL